MAGVANGARGGVDDAGLRLLRRRAAREGLSLRVFGQSMGRSISDGSEVLVVRYNTPRRGEVWAFVDDAGSIVVHRHRSSRDGRHWFRGDACTNDDPAVADDQLLGRVVQVTTQVGQRRLGNIETFRGRLRLDILSAAERIGRKWRRTD